MTTDPSTDDLTRFKAAALDQAGDAIIAINREGIIQVWNHAAHRLFHWSPEQTLGQDVKIMIPERLREAHDFGFFSAMEDGHLHSDGLPRRTKAVGPDGENIYAIMSFAVIADAAGTAIGSVAMAREWVRETTN